MIGEPTEPFVIRGVLGWSNRKGGLEAYGPGGRWDSPVPTIGNDPSDLLGDALDREGIGEGATLIVVAVTRSAYREDPDAADKVEAAVRDALDALDAEGS